MRHIINMKNILLMIATIFVLSLTVSCQDETTSTNYYTFTGETVADYLSHRNNTYSDFIEVLKRANYYSLLSTYGEFTCFAPTNSAMNEYMSAKGYKNVDEIPATDCDTLARTHIIKDGAYFTTDLTDGALPSMNMDDRYLVLSSDSDVENNNALTYYINKKAKMINYDDSVTNGVVHTINRVIESSNLFLPDLIEADQKATIFSQALQLTHMNDSLTRYIDNTYSCTGDSIAKGIYTFYGGYWQYAHFREKRYFKYTAFVEPDSIFKIHDIHNLNELKDYAKKIYDGVYPEDAGKYDEDFTNRKNPLNRFIAYHLINRMGNYNEWLTASQIRANCCVTDVADPEDFFETMCPGTIVRFCINGDGLFMNRKGLQKKFTVRGVRVFAPSEVTGVDQSALNGVYHYIDDILTYNTTTRDIVLNTRIRVDATTLSPDFMNQSARGNFGTDYLVGFKNGYIQDWKFSKETFIGVHDQELYWHSYEGDAICVTGIYDLTIKLPPVPAGTYEIRLGYTVGTERGVVQVYLNNQPCGIPIDLRIYGPDPKIGWVADVDDEETNNAADKAMRNRGYMKAMDSYRSSGGNVFRQNVENLRRILTTQYLTPDKTNYLRFRQVLDNSNCYLSFDYIELCPKSVYASPEGENKH